jgi:hypothetical protein
MCLSKLRSATSAFHFPFSSRNWRVPATRSLLLQRIAASHCRKPVQMPDYHLPQRVHDLLFAVPFPWHRFSFHCCSENHTRGDLSTFPLSHFWVLGQAVVEKAIDEALRVQTVRCPDAATTPDWLHGRRCLVAGLGPVGLLAGMVLVLRDGEVYGLDVVDANTARPKCERYRRPLY